MAKNRVLFVRLVKDVRGVVMGHLVAKLAEKHVHERRGVNLVILVCVIGLGEELGPAPALRNVLKEPGRELAVPTGARPGRVDLAEAMHCQHVALLCRERVVMDGLAVVPLGPKAVEILVCQPKLALGVLERRGLAEEFERLLLRLCHPLAELIEHTEPGERRRILLLRGLLVVLERSRVVLRDSTPVGMHLRQQRLGLGVASPGGPLEVPDRLWQVLCVAVPAVVEELPHDNLRLHPTLLCGQLIVLQHVRLPLDPLPALLVCKADPLDHFAGAVECLEVDLVRHRTVVLEADLARLGDEHTNVVPVAQVHLGKCIAAERRKGHVEQRLRLRRVGPDPHTVHE